MRGRGQQPLEEPPGTSWIGLVTRVVGFLDALMDVVNVKLTCGLLYSIESPSLPEAFRQKHSYSPSLSAQL